VLVLLATAPRFAFGTGPHACAAAQLAPRIVDAAVTFARSHIALDQLERRGFLPLQNVRIPVLA
jgi:cytochrome P450